MDILWLNVGADFLLALAFYSVPIALLILVRKRREVSFPWAISLFILFSFLCATTHAFSIYTAWIPSFMAGAILKGMTAIAAVVTAVQLWALLPTAISLPSADELAEKNRNLQRANESLEGRVKEKVVEMLSSRDQLIAANKAKDEFLATLSHELRTPLGVTMGYVDLLHLADPSSEDFKQALQAIKRSVKTQTSLVADLLDVSRIITGNLPLNLSEVAVKELLNETIETVSFAAEAKEISVSVHIDEEVGTLVADKARLQQALWNLLSNAIKFTPKKGLVKVSVVQVGSDLEFCVEDSGRGISQQNLPFIFERFWQENSTKTREHGGLGLGLAIVRHISESHGGEVSVASEGLNKGAVFKMRIPIISAAKNVRLSLVKNDAPTKLVAADFHGSKILDGYNILAVDDQEDSLVLLKKVLTLSGAQVTTASCGQEALDKLARRTFDAIISDIGMPKMNGLEMIAAVRKNEEALGRPPTPAIALTAFASTRDAQDAIQAGFQIPVTKPFSLSDLTGKIHRLITKAKAAHA